MTERQPLDAYYTAQPLADAIVCHLRDQRIIRPLAHAPLAALEPSAGKGAFARAVEQHASPYEVAIECVELDPVRAHELQVAGFRTHNADFLGWSPGHSGFDLVIGNPPFARDTGRVSKSGKPVMETVFDSHVEHAIGMAHVVAFVLRLAALASKDRTKFWSLYPAARVDIIRPRPSFTGSGTDNSEYALFTWVRGDTSMRLGHIDWVPEKKERKRRAASEVAA